VLHICKRSLGLAFVTELTRLNQSKVKQPSQQQCYLNLQMQATRTKTDKVTDKIIIIVFILDIELLLRQRKLSVWVEQQ
jgi:hypothetical protein